jgi:hypothetical protein
MRRLSPVEALKPQARPVAVAVAVAVTATGATTAGASAAVTLRRLLPHWPLILQGRQTWTSTTSSNIDISQSPKLNRRRYPKASYTLATSPTLRVVTVPTRYRRLSLSGAMASAFSAYHGPTAVASQHTITALGRWSVLNHALPGS